MCMAGSIHGLTIPGLKKDLEGGIGGLILASRRLQSVDLMIRPDFISYLAKNRFLIQHDPGSDNCTAAVLTQTEKILARLHDERCFFFIIRGKALNRDRNVENLRFSRGKLFCFGKTFQFLIRLWQTAFRSCDIDLRYGTAADITGVRDFNAQFSLFPVGFECR